MLRSFVLGIEPAGDELLNRLLCTDIITASQVDGLFIIDVGQEMKPVVVLFISCPAIPLLPFCYYSLVDIHLSNAAAQSCHSISSQIGQLAIVTIIEINHSVNSEKDRESEYAYHAPDLIGTERLSLSWVSTRRSVCTDVIPWIFSSWNLAIVANMLALASQRFHTGGMMPSSLLLTGERSPIICEVTLDECCCASLDIDYYTVSVDNLQKSITMLDEQIECFFSGVIPLP